MLNYLATLLPVCLQNNINEGEDSEQQMLPVDGLSGKLFFP